MYGTFEIISVEGQYYFGLFTGTASFVETIAFKIFFSPIFNGFSWVLGKKKKTQFFHSSEFIS